MGQHGVEMLSELALGCLLFPGLFTLSKRCLQKMPVLGWGESDAIIVATRLVSSVQAIMASTAGIIIVRSCSKHVLEERHWLANAYVLFAVPYFAYDIYAMYLCHWYKYMVKGHEAHTLSKRTVLTSYLRKELLMIVHHTVMFAVCFPVSVFLRNGRGDFFVGCMFMAEVSTPFVCLGKVLIQYRQQHTLLHKLNGVMMLATFFVCRILLFPYMYWVYGQQTELPFHRVPIELPIQCNIGVLLLMAPQIYWFFLICRGAFRLFRKTKSKEQHLNGYVALAPAPPTAPPTVPEDQKPV